MRTVLYRTSEEKATAVTEAEELGETQIHDNYTFDEDGTFTSGELVFDIKVATPSPPPTAEQVEFEDLRGKIRGEVATLPELRRYLVLRDGL